MPRFFFFTASAVFYMARIQRLSCPIDGGTHLIPIGRLSSCCQLIIILFSIFAEGILLIAVFP